MGTLAEPEPTMRMDVSEKPKAYSLKAELPGVAKGDVTVALDGNTVSVAAEVKREKEEKEGEKVLRSERYYGSIARSMTLPEEVDVEHAEAVFEKGVLPLTLPKAPGGTSRKLAIR